MKIRRPWVGGEGMMDCGGFALKGRWGLKWLTSNPQLRSFNWNWLHLMHTFSALNQFSLCKFGFLAA